MSIRVVFFASLREELGHDQLTLDMAPGTRVSALIAALADQYDAGWQTILTAENIRVAINHEMISEDAVISEGDEVAFFPPVTGG